MLLVLFVPDQEVVFRSPAGAELTEAQPDRGWVDDWLHRSYLEYWTGGCAPTAPLR